jgi:tungstate transport system ATP-binding protein
MNTPSPSPPLLSIFGLEKKYGHRTLLQIDLLTIAAASAYVLTGINGAGKSTLLRILCGLESATIQQAFFGGKPILFSHYPRVLREAIGYVHQQPAMFASSVADNIAYGLNQRNLPADEVEERVEEAMQWAGVGHLGDRRSATLSGGEKQRVALARAKILRPKLLLLDEPTANLDGAAREQVIALIPTLIEEGSSVIMVCHDRDLIGLPDVQRLKLRDGRLERH